MSKELLAIVEVVSNEKDVSRDTIFQALEAALAAATRKRFADEEIEVRVSIDRKTGAYETFRLWHVVDDEDFLENPDAQMRETVARLEFPEANLSVGDVHEIQIENEEFGRISAMMAKQTIIQKLREAEREKVYQQFIDQEGTLIHGIVRRFEKNNAIVDVGGVEGTILRNEMIPREKLRVGDRVLGYLKKVNADLRGPQLQISRVEPEFLIQLFQKEVPEIASGNIEIMGAARDPGLRAKLAVRSFDPRIDPVGACVGMRGARVQGVMNEVGGEGVDIVLWDEDAETYVRKAMAPAVITDTAIDEEGKVIEVAVPEEKLAQAVGRGGQNVRLASELTGWQITVLSEKEFAERQASLQGEREQVLTEILGLDESLVAVLTAAGYADAEALAYAEREDLLALEGLDDAAVDTILERATDYLLQQAFAAESDPEAEMQTLVAEMESVSAELAEKLVANDVNTQEDVAELSVDELMEIGGLGQEEAAALILTAREPWFR